MGCTTVTSPLESQQHQCHLVCVLPLPVHGMRHQSADQHHHFLKGARVIQPEGTDPFHRVKQDQQMWNNTEQWEGYSDVYLKRWMQYTPTNARCDHLEHNNKDLNEILALTWKYYGEAADILETLEDDPLQPEFHILLERAKKHGAEFEASIDAIYRDSHPTIKTVADAYMVQRHYALQDWYQLVQRKRNDILANLTPAYVEEQAKMKARASRHVWRLQKLGEALSNDPVLFLQHDTTLSPPELEVVRQRARYFKTFEKYAKSVNVGEYLPQ